MNMLSNNIPELKESRECCIYCESNQVHALLECEEEILSYNQ
jgi:hypothetical protein